MTPDAASLLRELRDHGIELEIVGHRLRYRPKSAVTPELRERMAACQEGLLALIEQLEERAAIMEFDGGLSRAEAERQAGLFPEPSAVRDPEASGSVGPG